MIQKIKRLLLNATVVSLALTPMLAPVAVHAQGPDPTASLCGGAATLQIDGTGECNDPDAETNVNNLITTIINIFSVVVGIIAVIMIIYGGFRYITSGGDSGNIGNAKNTIVFAIVGLIIVALAQIIVRFVLHRAVGEVTT